MARELSYAVLHGSIHHPDTGQIGPVLTLKGDSAHKAVKSMIQLNGEVVVEVPNAKNPKLTTTFLIDNSGFTHRVLAKATDNLHGYEESQAV
jgi:hypothetical protein